MGDEFRSLASEERSAIDLPLIWPDLNEAGEGDAESTNDAFYGVLSSARSIFGTVHDMDEVAAATMERLLTDATLPLARMVVPVFPGCSANAGVLSRLLSLQSTSVGRIQFRILAAAAWRSAATTALCVVQEPGRVILACGPGGMFSDGGSPGQANLMVSCEPLLRGRLCCWFDRLWERSAPLNSTTAAVPTLSFSPASEAATAAWNRYEALCANTARVSPVVVVAGPDRGSGNETRSQHRDDHRGMTAPSTVTAEIGITAIDPTGEEIGRIATRGLQVAIDGTTRIPPLSTPISAALFGIESNRQIGLIHRNTRYSIDAFDGRTQRAIERKRKQLSDLLRHLCYSLGDGLYWIPRTAVPLMEREVERVNRDGVALLSGATGADVSKYLQGQRGRIAADANRAYQELRPGGRLSDGDVSEILSSLEKRLTSACAGRLLPKLSYSEIRFRLEEGSSTASAWGQPLTLLRSIAELPRKVLTDRRYLLGTSVDEAELLPAMDVVGDHLVALYRSGKPVRKLAELELGYLEDISDSKAGAEKRCKAILRLLHGDPHEDLMQELDVATAE